MTASKLPPPERSVRAFVAAMQRGGVTLHAMPDGSILGRRTARSGEQEDVPLVWQAEIDKRRDEIAAMFDIPRPAPPSPTRRGGTPVPVHASPAQARNLSGG